MSWGNTSDLISSQDKPSCLMTLMVIITGGKRKCTKPKTNRHTVQPAALEQIVHQRVKQKYFLCSIRMAHYFLFWRRQQAVAQNCPFSMPQLPDCHPASEKKNPQKGKQKTEKLLIVRVISGPSGDESSLFSNSRETGTQMAVK